MEISSKQEKSNLFLYFYVFMFISGLLVCFLRSAYTIFSPVMLTEDGPWTSSIIIDGIGKTILTAKPSYFVVGNLLILQVALTINQLIFGFNIAHLPVIIAGLVHVFYTILAFLPVILLKQFINFKVRIVLFFMILLMPFGDSISEIYGRASNIGYGCFFISFVLMLFIVLDEKSPVTGDKFAYKKIVAYLGILLCCVTNPTCYVIMAFAIIYNGVQLFIKYKLKLFFSKGAIILYINGVLSILTLIAKYMLLNGEVGQRGISINFSELIEYFFRSLTFCFTFPFYKYMNDILAAILILFFICLLTISFFNIADKKFQGLLFISYSFTIFNVIITLVMRKTLTHHLYNYITSFPDRYFYACNLMVLFDLALILSASLDGKIKFKPISQIINFFWQFTVLLYIANWKTIFELNESCFVDCTISFEERVVNAYFGQPESNVYFIDIETPGWGMLLPYDYVVATVSNNEANKFIGLQAANLTDTNWLNGVSRDFTIVLFKNDDLTRYTFENASYLGCNGEIAEITFIEYAGDYIRVNIGGDASYMQYPAEIVPLRSQNVGEYLQSNK